MKSNCMKSNCMKSNCMKSELVEKDFSSILLKLQVASLDLPEIARTIILQNTF